MSTRTNLKPSQVIPSAQAVPPSTGSMAASIISAPTLLQSISQVCYSVNWTGTSPVGTISVQASNDYSLNPNGTVENPGTWSTMVLQYNGTAVTTIPISGNTGNGLIDITDTAAYAIRLVYTFTSGTGTMTATVSGKVA